MLADVQEDDGYLNSYYQGVHPDRKLREFHWGHEMYCAGHLLQAAVAVARSTGRAHVLAVATRLADLLVRRFGASGEEAIDGHPEIETALVELYRLTNEAAYLQLATRFVELRGRGLLGPDRFGANYFQDHAPVREATEPTGHAVRQLYLAAGVTDVYLEGADDDAAGRDGGAVGRTSWPPRPTSPARTGRATATRPSATRTSCRPTARMPRRAPRSRASSGTGGCCWPRAAGATPTRWSGCSTTRWRAGRRSRAIASSTPTRCNCAPGTTAPTRTTRRGAWIGTAARAARRTSRAWSHR